MTDSKRVNRLSSAAILAKLGGSAGATNATPTLIAIQATTRGLRLMPPYIDRARIAQAAALQP